MTISGNYPQPVYVNGYRCNNCTDVENAKKHIDPAHPKSGPYNVNAGTDPSRRTDPSVTFGGALAGLNDADNGAKPESASEASADRAAPGSLLDLSA